MAGCDGNCPELSSDLAVLLATRIPVEKIIHRVVFWGKYFRQVHSGRSNQHEAVKD